MEINGYMLESEEKLSRVDAKFEGEELLAQYDRLGGLITKGGRKVKTGSFWDFAMKKAHKAPKVVFVISVGGEIVEVAEGEALPLEVQAAEMLATAKAKKTKKAK